MRYESKRPRRQFLAGVKCPKCDEMDAVVQVRLFEPIEDEYIECTKCGHSERRPDPDEIAEKNALANDAMSTGTQGTVKFFE